MELTQTTFTVGKYKGQHLERVLKDRSYCRWLIKQEWFKTGYEYLHNRIADYDPTVYFLKRGEGGEGGEGEFVDTYKYFNLVPPGEVEVDLTDDERTCYAYYVDTVDNLRARIREREANGDENIYAVKAPVKWLQKFEQESELPRSAFKDFMTSYDLPNITYIVEDIKKEGGIEYKGAKSFLIAKERSEKQEAYWEEILKKAYDEDLGTQYKYKDCCFDFICIPSKTIFECKLGFKDLLTEQYKKYRIALCEYKIVYLIGYSILVSISEGKIYTTDVQSVIEYQAMTSIPSSHHTPFDPMFSTFEVVEIHEVQTWFTEKPNAEQQRAIENNGKQQRDDTMSPVQGPSSDRDQL